MTSARLDRVFVDTAYVQAIFNKSDQLHDKARALAPALEAADLVVTTEAVLIEVANALASRDRTAANAFISSCYSTPNLEVVPFSPDLWKRGLAKYREYEDKEWSLTDCISFLVMQEKGINAAATKDQHYSQAGSKNCWHDFPGLQLALFSLC